MESFNPTKRVNNEKRKAATKKKWEAKEAAKNKGEKKSAADNLEKIPIKK